MKNSFLLILMSLIPFFVISQNCDDAFSAANYCVSNTKKAYEANNSQQVREWTEKAIEAFTEVEEITGNCGCVQVSELAYQGYEACDKAQEEDSYERTRFFAKRAREKARLMMEALSKCTDIPISDIERRRNAGAASLGYSENLASNSLEDNLNSQQEELLAKQKELLEQQRILERQLAEQAKQVAALKQKKANELIQQKRIKVSAEIALAEIQKNNEKLATSLGCSTALQITKISFVHGVEALEKESLSNTKMYYYNKMNEITEQFSEAISKCASEW